MLQCHPLKTPKNEDKHHVIHRLDFDPGFDSDESEDDSMETIDACRKMMEYYNKADALLEAKIEDTSVKKENYREAIFYYQELVDLYKKTNSRPITLQASTKK